jgi:gamma-glutamylcyclotransferase (GGCT)/AIG2-like uncharacterized protein YtfP
MKKVFVYGSLKEGRSNAYLLSGSKLLGEALTRPSFTMLNLGVYPGVVLKGSTAIHGEVYEVSEITFARLDMLEGYPSFYDRMEIDTEYGAAWIYFLASPDDYSERRIVEGGIW